MKDVNNNNNQCYTPLTRNSNYYNFLDNSSMRKNLIKTLFSDLNLISCMI